MGPRRRWQAEPLRNASEPSRPHFTYVARFGDDALDPLTQLLDVHHPRADITRAVARAICLLSNDRALEVLCARAAHPSIFEALREAAQRIPAVCLAPLARTASGRGAVATKAARSSTRCSKLVTTR